MKILKMLFGVAAAALVFSSAFGDVSVGEKAPDFTLTDINGESHSLSDFAGKVVVLEWTNYGCPFVKKHYDSGNMQGLQAKMAGKEVVWLSICSSAQGKQGSMSPAEWAKTAEKKGVKSAGILLDESGKVGRLYGARATPHMFVIDEKGILAYNGAIDSISSASAADIAKAKNYVTAAVDALLSGQSVEKASTQPYGCSIKWAN